MAPGQGILPLLMEVQVHNLEESTVKLDLLYPFLSLFLGKREDFVFVKINEWLNYLKSTREDGSLRI